MTDNKEKEDAIAKAADALNKIKDSLDKNEPESPGLVAEIETLISAAMELFAPYAVNLTPIERRRRTGAGIRNYGFFELAFHIAMANSSHVPGFISLADFEEAFHDFENKRAINSILRAFQTETNDSELDAADRVFRQFALPFYNYLREAARQGDPIAQTEFERLRLRFRRQGRNTSEEPTEMEVERDVRALLHGKKDGRIVIENEKPVASGGKHVVIDETHKEHAAFKATEEEKL